MKRLDVIAAILLVIGGLNWGLVGLFHFGLVASIFRMHFGQTNAITSIIYTLVGASAVYQAVGLRGFQHRWGVDAHAR